MTFFNRHHPVCKPLISSGTFTSLRHLNARDQKKLLESDVFRLSHDDWMAAPGKVQWSEGQGEFYFKGYFNRK